MDHVPATEVELHLHQGDRVLVLQAQGVLKLLIDWKSTSDLAFI